MTAKVKRREFITLIGVLTGAIEGDSEPQDRYVAFRQAMQHLGWIEGRSVRYEQRSTSATSVAPAIVVCTRKEGAAASMARATPT